MAAQVQDKVVYNSPQQFPEGIDWDAKNGRFLVGSVLKGNILAIYPDGTTKEVVKDEEYSGCATLGLQVDLPRNRFVVTVHSNNPAAPYDGVAAYDLDSGKRQFLTKLSDVPVETPPVNLPIFANDSAVDAATGEVYITDTQRSLLWKTDADGSNPRLFSGDPLFAAFPKVYFGPFDFGLNGLVVHQDGYIITTHVGAGVAYKVPLDGSPVKKVEIDGLFPGADGIRFRPDGRLVVTSDECVYLVESTDGWETAKILDKVPQDPSISTTAVAIRDGRAYINYAFFAEAFGGKERSEFFLQTADFRVDK
ncbi:Calcium-dependent phosphotriesterase superfamily protein [Klebsormidium nitens]|uniref:Calcium-dependent phosphotriesterase superfamily protein n=1 Tax=Klebsormidium nitens TaxID=105231 RepID=A0A1Y1IRY6_KLENI|nr:Calcium-dependent phosphotriesterase superfamily protein [Klebsormidium nitens]|eukprot:GAQ92782.1 Calcium-dependent phosphotriesterase superfamily protein [Klebsormidium nitens]